MKCTGAESDAFEGAGAVCIVHCAIAFSVCNLLPAKDNDLAVETESVKLDYIFKKKSSNQ